MKKHPGTALVCLLLCAALAACGQQEPATTSTSTSEPEPYSSSAPETAVSDSSSESLAENPGRSDRQPYGVFIGLDANRADLLADYELVVIDAAYYTAGDISAIKADGTAVYSYLNIGTIETFRTGYDALAPFTLAEYDDWPGEYWMDVSAIQWQQYIADAARALAAKGVDGFFLDNTDVYYLYPTTEILGGLVDIITDLNTLGLDVVINGGDVFVTAAVLDSHLVSITGVNQECVFTGIDF